MDECGYREMRFRESQLARTARTSNFEMMRFVLRDVDGEPLRELPAPWQINTSSSTTT